MLFLITIYVNILFCLDLRVVSVALDKSARESDKLSLLSFKDKIAQDPLQVLNSWNDSVSFCEWTGIICDSNNQRVVTLSLEGWRLAGSLTPSIGNLTFLTGINLRNNSFHGEIPQDLGRLSHLQYLNLTRNLFSGEIPQNLSHCLDLKVLDVVYNELVGNIPNQLSSLTKLEILGLGANNLTGAIPPWIANFSSLLSLSLAMNNLQGEVPSDLGRMSRLRIFKIFANSLSGTVPISIYNISSMYYFSVTNNHFHGRLPPNIGHTLPNLQFFLGGINNFSGPIPISLTNLTSLVNVDFKKNSLTGQLPVNIGKLRGLIRLNFGSNLLGTGEASDLGFLPSLSNCTSLQVLSIDNNRLGGELPVSIANLSTQMWILTMGGNLLKGSIPVGIGNLVNLTLLAIEENNLTGSVPKDIGNLQMLRQLFLSRNGLSGSIPSSFGNLTQLISLSMAENRLEGSIPSSLGNCRNLISLNLSHNFLKGTIPKEVIGLSSLSISFSASHNSLSGSLPLEVGDLKNLEELQLSENKLSGRIPSTLGNCLSLERLRMAGNFFQGTIPESLSDLRGIQEMDLSRNSLSGKIPEFLTKLSSLYFLNLSFNYLTGEVPKEGIFRNATAVSLRGNSKLCSDDQELELSACHEQGSPTSGKSLSGRDVALIALAIVVFLPLSVFCTLYWLRCRRRNSTTTASPSSEEWHSEISYLELLKATDGFSSDSLRGVGSFGSVYKGTLYKDGSIVAVKVLNLHERGASKSFITECNALRNIRHRNLVKIISACSSVDPQGNDFKALVLEFMPNGSLEEWLHPNIDEKHEARKLSIGQRLSIAIDVAFAMEYLHHHIQTPIVHCDLKPSNVLLDEDMIAHVGDFGLAKFLYETTESIQAMSAGLKGSIGYIPPEYGMGGQVSILGDAYSYGVLLLEMFTGKRPTDDMFKDGLTLYKFAEMALPDGLIQIADPRMLSAPKQDETSDAIYKYASQGSSDETRLRECLVSVIRIGLSCCRPSPGDRMLVKEAVRMLQDVRRSNPEF